MAQAIFLRADYPDSLNSSFFRIDTPAKFLRKAGHEIETAFVDDRAFLSSVPEVVLIERKVTTELVELLRLAGAKRIVATFDDNYALIPHINNADAQQSRSYWKANINDFRKAIGMCDLCIVPSRRLITDFQRYGRMALVENYYDPDLWKDLPEKPIGTLKIGWGGTWQHRATWEQTSLIGALRRLAVDYPHLVVETYGADLRDLFEGTGINHQQRQWQSFQGWVKALSQFDIGLAPMAGEYDKRRSNLKVVEYGLARVPWIGSEIVYIGIPGGRTVKDETDSWYKTLKWMASKAHIELAEEGYRWARKYLMDRHVGTYEQVLFGG